jgi:hypothetical protein
MVFIGIPMLVLLQGANINPVLAVIQLTVSAGVGAVVAPAVTERVAHSKIVYATSFAVVAAIPIAIWPEQGTTYDPFTLFFIWLVLFVWFLPLAFGFIYWVSRD